MAGSGRPTGWSLSLAHLFSSAIWSGEVNQKVSHFRPALIFSGLRPALNM